MIDIDADEAYRNQVKANYEFVTWAGHTREGTPDVRLRDLRIGSAQIEKWKLEAAEELQTVRERRQLRYIYVSRESDGRRRPWPGDRRASRCGCLAGRCSRGC